MLSCSQGLAICHFSGPYLHHRTGSFIGRGWTGKYPNNLPVWNLTYSLIIVGYLFQVTEVWPVMTGAVQYFELLFDVTSRLHEIVHTKRHGRSYVPGYIPESVWRSASSSKLQTKDGNSAVCRGCCLDPCGLPSNSFSRAAALPQ